MNNYSYLNELYNNLYRDYPNRTVSTSINLYSPTEGYMKGNLFSNIYSEYKNYTPQTLRPKTEQERDLYELSTVAFAAHELNLYLDIHPEDTSLLQLFKDYEEKCKVLTEQYERKYGPQSVSGITSSKEFNWVNNWPWEGYNV